jgi:hypothetical protein
MASWGTPLRTLFNAVYDSALGALHVKTIPAAHCVPDAYALSATGADAFATILTPSEDKAHLAVYNAGTHPAVLSLDAGTTAHLYVPGQATQVFDWIYLEQGVAIQARNATPGSNYTNLYLMIW